MLIGQPDNPMHLTYCLNVHPGETWADHLAAIKDYTIPIATNVAGVAGVAGGADQKPFGLGLRLGHLAADQLADPKTLAAFKNFLDDANLYAFTVNGFPYGTFHGARVKEAVYRPDWTEAKRRDYTLKLAEILAALLPAGTDGSISTVPLSFKPFFADLKQAAAMLAQTAQGLADIEDRTGRRIILALEPEPGCELETTDEAIKFFAGPLAAACDADLKSRYLGLCLDTAHQAVEFEDLAGSLDKLAAAEITLGKIQLSSAPIYKPTQQPRELLSPFIDEVYLHQTGVMPPSGRPQQFFDLPVAMDCIDPNVTQADEWRIHYHVPLYAETIGELATTRDLLTGRFAEKLAAGACPHIEVETYTWGLLPGGDDKQTLIDNITRELQWAKSLIA